jgi:uncharacterized membrane protein
MASSNPGAGTVLRSSWEFFRKHINWLWQVGLLLALPSIVQSLIANPRTELSEEDLEGITSLGELTENVFGFSLASLGLLVAVWLVLLLIYNAIAYGGGIAALLKNLRGTDSEAVGFSSLLAQGTTHFRSVFVASIAVFALVAVGMVAFIVPGIIAAFLLAFTVHYVVDKNLTTGEAMKASYHSVKNNVGFVLMTVLGLFLANFLVTLGASIVFAPFDGRLLALLNGLLGAALAAFSLVVLTRLYLAIEKSK